jgi:replication initiation protein RepC
MQQFSQELNRAPMRGPTKDARWVALGLVQAAREALSLRDRDIAVLRGLLSCIPADRWDGPLMVHASNATLQARCDGMDERTLRRRLARLCEVGLIRRAQSPNRKRYVVRDVAGQPVLTYGFDLSPLRNAQNQLRGLGEEIARTQHQIRMAKAVLRDHLYRLAQRAEGNPDLSDRVVDMTRWLRRKSTLADLSVAIAEAEAMLDEAPRSAQTSALPALVTATDGQNDRHIQSSNQEYLEEERAHEDLVSSLEQPAAKHHPAEQEPRKESSREITVATCVAAAKSSMEFAQETPANWRDLFTLATSLAPAIGINREQMLRSEQILGPRGASMAILGLVEAFPRIRDPKRYLNTLLSRAGTIGLNMERMFRSLTGWARFPAGNQMPAAS